MFACCCGLCVFICLFVCLFDFGRDGGHLILRSTAGTLPGWYQDSDGVEHYALVFWLRHWDPVSLRRPTYHSDSRWVWTDGTGFGTPACRGHRTGTSGRQLPCFARMSARILKSSRCGLTLAVELGYHRVSGTDSRQPAAPRRTSLPNRRRRSTRCCPISRCAWLAHGSSAGTC